MLTILPKVVLAEPVGQLPENLSPTPGETPPPDVEGDPNLCVIYQMRRGPGAFSRWRGSNDWPYYNAWSVWIGDEEMNQHTWERYLAYSRQGWRAEAGYGGYASDIRERRNLLPLPPSTYNGNYDPCNRAYGSQDVCMDALYEMPVTISHNGRDYQLMDRPFSEGGRCGSPQCLCIVSGRISPIVIDFRGRGINYTEFGKHVTFDFGEGVVASSWVANPQGVSFLALDKNENGTIDSISELFGDRSVEFKDGEKMNGFEALKRYDANRDSIIDEKDPIFTKLLVWTDKNSNAKTEKGELRSLKDAKIRSFDLGYKDSISNQDSYGNGSRQTGSAKLESGQEIATYDIWFAPVHPKSVQGVVSSHSRVSSVPSEGELSEKIRKEWSAALEQEDFGESEIPYQYGKVQIVLAADGSIEKRIVSWKHRGASCRVDVEFTKDWKKTSSYSACN